MKLTRAQMIRAAVGGPLSLSLLLQETLPATAQNATLAKARQAVAKGLDYLRKTQETDGSWGHYPATAALALSAFLRNGRTELNDPAVASGVKFLTRAQKPNGAIYSDANAALALPNYNTSLALVSLAETHNPAYKTVIQKAQAYLSKAQFDEEEGINPSNPMYGGIGYGDDPGDETHPDLSNLQHALEALHVSGMPSNAPVFKNALIFLQRVQNRRESNDQAWVKEGPNDGGFVYEAQGGSKANEANPTAPGKHTSYGAMTYAGLKSYIYCGVTKSDPRAKAAYDWLRSHYSVTEHPGMCTNSLYYYYHTMAKTLDVYGQKILTEPNGKPHDWAQDLAAQLVASQRPDGAWFNTNARYWENQPGLVTSYSLIALSYCVKK